MHYDEFWFKIGFSLPISFIHIAVAYPVRQSYSWIHPRLSATIWLGLWKSKASLITKFVVCVHTSHKRSLQAILIHSQKAWDNKRPTKYSLKLRNLDPNALSMHQPLIVIRSINYQHTHHCARSIQNTSIVPRRRYLFDVAIWRTL